MSQYKNCIVRYGCKRQGCLCHKTGSCVATRRWARKQARARGEGGGGSQGARGALGRAHADAGRADAWLAGGAQGRGAGSSGTQGTRGARGKGARGARGRGAQARQGTGSAGCALGALRLVFNLVFRLGIFPESLNEHCSL